MDRQVKLWFIQRLIKLWIKEKGAEKCVLMQDALSEKFSGIDENGFVWWDAFKHVENPSALMSDKAFRDYMDGVYEQMAQLIPYLYVQLEKEYEQLEQELYMILEKKAMYSTPMLDMLLSGFSNPVAITVIWISSPIDSSVTVPNMIFASGSTLR